MVRQAIKLRAAVPASVGTTQAASETALLEARATEVHGALDPIAANMRTTAVPRTSGDTFVAGGVRALSPAQRALLRPGETAARLPGVHAKSLC